MSDANKNDQPDQQQQQPAATRPAPPARDDAARANLPSAQPEQQPQTPGVSITVGGGPATLAPAPPAENNSNGGNDDNDQSPMVPAPATDGGNKNNSKSHELPQTFTMLWNVLCFGLGLICLILFFHGLSNGYIITSNHPTITLTNTSISANAIQIINDGEAFSLVVVLIIGLIACPFNIVELLYPVVMAKHRIKQLVFNRVASGAQLANAIMAITSVIQYVSRRKLLTADADVTGYNTVLAFWIMLLLAALSQMLVHRLTPNEQKRRHDKAGSQGNNGQQQWDGEDFATYDNSPDRMGEYQQ